MRGPAVKKKPRGRPFTGRDDPRRKSGGGRPKNENSLTYWLRRKMDEKQADGRTQAEVLAEAIVLGALKGDPRMVSIIWERTEGKVAEQVNVGQTGDALKLLEIAAIARKQAALIRDKAPELVKEFAKIMEKASADG